MKVKVIHTATIVREYDSDDFEQYQEAPPSSKAEFLETIKLGIETDPEYLVENYFMDKFSISTLELRD